MTIAREKGIEVREQSVPREMLYAADELFFTGTASEVTPIRSVDKITIGSGRCGEITRTLQQHFLKVVRGEVPDTYGWLTIVRSSTPAATS
jgi:branched-chain amino acid aminotransferase